MPSPNKLFVYTASAIVVAQMAVVLLSWIVSAGFPYLGVRSLLSDEGLRLMLSGYLHSVSHSALSLLLLLCITLGAVVRSGVAWAFVHWRRLDFRHRYALRVCSGVLCVAVAVLIVVVAVPHSPMLSATGTFFPGPLASALLAYGMVVLVILSYCYGVLGGDMADSAVATDVATFGLRKAAWLVVLYVMAVELVSSVKFIICL